MKVYIVRHGKAEKESSSLRDEDRILTARGAEQARFLGAQIAAAQFVPSLILTSKVTRALETARIIHSFVRCRIDTAAELHVDESVASGVELLMRQAFPAKGKPPECLMLVGHNPQVSDLCEVLVNGIGAAKFLFRTGEAMMLDLNRASLIGSGRLVAQIRLEEECGAGHGLGRD